jgi:plastocyanin domain-containing protein
MHFRRNDERAPGGAIFFPDFAISRRLPRDRTTTVELQPDRRGDFLFLFADGDGVYTGTFNV